MSSSMLFEVATSLLLQITLLVACAWGIDRACGSARRSTPIWTTAFSAVLALTFCAFFLPHFRWLVLPPVGKAATWGTVLRCQIIAVNSLAAIWLIGFVISLVLRFHRFLTLLYFLKSRCRPLTNQQIRSLPGEILSEAPEGTRWLLSDVAHGPFCWQLQRPTVVLPPSILDAEADTKRHVLRHELEHLRTGHPVQQFLQGLCSTLLWFHPALRLASRRAELTREYWCDEVAAETRAGIAGYLRSLATISEQSLDAPPCTLAIGRRGPAIVRRSCRLVELSKRRGWSPGSEKTSRLHRFAVPLIVVFALLISQVWLPVNLLASDRESVSPWPSWTAGMLHDFGVSVRDYEPFDHRREAHELLVDD